MFVYGLALELLVNISSICFLLGIVTFSIKVWHNGRTPLESGTTGTVLEKDRRRREERREEGGGRREKGEGEEGRGRRGKGQERKERKEKRGGSFTNFCHSPHVMSNNVCC